VVFFIKTIIVVKKYLERIGKRRKSDGMVERPYRVFLTCQGLPETGRSFETTPGIWIFYDSQIKSLYLPPL